METLSLLIVLKYAGYFTAGLLGVFTHFLKQKIKGQTLKGIKKWFFGHAKDSLLALIMYIVVFAYLCTSGSIAFVSAFMAGYMSDSIFSRIAKEEEEEEDKQ